MNISIEDFSKFSMIKLSGRLDAATSPEFQKKAFELIEKRASNLVVSCKELEYISSAGLRIFYLILKELNKTEGKVVISEPTTNVKKVLDMVDLSSDIPVLNSFEETIAFLK